MSEILPLSFYAHILGFDAESDAQCVGLCTDTRILKTGEIYIALKGENFDGHAFVQQALDDGAIAVVVSEPTQVQGRVWQVENTSDAYLKLASGYFNEVFTGQSLGITGSNGKTTLKEMMASILSQKGSVLATEKNYNNEVGLPRTLMQAKRTHQYAVLEMGAAKPNDIAWLTRWIQLDVAVVNNVSAAHLGGYDSVEQIAQTKGAIYQALKSQGTSVIPRVSDYRNTLVDLAEGHKIQTVLPDSECIFELSLLGAHHQENALTAWTMAKALNVDDESIRVGLKQVQAEAGRLKLHEVSSKLNVIDDTYNANGASIKAAVDVLTECDGQTALVLGAMAELGQQSDEIHQAVGDYAKARVNQVWSLNAPAYGVNNKNDFETLMNSIEEWIQSQDKATILVKGSRSAKMERVIEQLMEAHLCS